jgi:hypothetical protein
VRSRRPATSALLLAGTVVLIVSILIGEKLGDRVLLQTEERVPIAGAGITPVPQVEPSDRDDLRNWKRLQIVAVDPGFPDPRVTRPPTPRPTASPSPSPSPSATPKRRSVYTPPPLPLPLVSHLPTEVSTEPPVP